MAANPFSNRLIAAFVATIAALVISMFGSGQWASADGHGTSPTPEPSSTPSAPRHVLAKAGDESAAVTWFKPEGDTAVTGYVVTAHPSGITVESTDGDMLVIVRGLENGVEYVFTVVAFNEHGDGDVSERSNAVVPQDGLVLNEEQLERLRQHLRDVAHEAHERFEDAQKRAREKLEETKDRVHDRLDEQTDRAREFVEKAREQAAEHNDNQAEKARTWFERFKHQLAEKVARAEGTDRYDEVRERAGNALDDAKEKLSDRLENSRVKTEARVDRVEEKAHDRVENAQDRADSAIERTEQRLTEQISKLRDRLQELLRRLAKIWAERAGNNGGA
ncbi:MAG: fibronectin type III domain-containing protein [Chloroflexi bacterium]|nr:fibronectin type III domain-containing protein [Chloroflexota bacterium]